MEEQLHKAPRIIKFEKLGYFLSVAIPSKSPKALNSCEAVLFLSFLSICGVAASKVFPHNLRHLFARTFYKVSKNVVELADVLGHSGIETARIYLISTSVEHARQLDCLELLA